MERADCHVSVEQVTYRYGVSRHRAVIDNLSFALKPQEHLGVIGPSGCGKSTLVRLVAGLLEPERGRVSIFGRSPQESYVTRAVGLDLQDQSLAPWLTARRNVELPASGLDPSVKNEATRLLREFGLLEKLDAYPSELSGGMKARVALARALVNAPKLVILDEPFSALDELTTIQVCKKLISICRFMSLLVVSHNLDAVARIAHRCLCMSPLGPSPIEEVDLMAFGIPEERTESQVKDARATLLSRYIKQ